MFRILLMVFYNLIHVPTWGTQMLLYARKNDKHSEEERYRLLQKITLGANRGGRVKIHAEGMENLPEKNGFIFYPNHQGLFDVLAVLESCPKPFTVVMKKEVQNIPFLKQVFAIMRAKAIDRENVRQGMQVILDVVKEVREGRNYLIFAEGTRSKVENVPQEFKGGSFKAAMKAKCPIVPVAIIDAFKPFDRKSIAPVTVQVYYMKPLYYEQYKDMKSTELAAYVKEQITEEIGRHLNV